MTRGTGYLITHDMVYSHDEFNGDMYRNGYGASFIKMLSECDAQSFKSNLEDWNIKHHNYNGLEIHADKLSTCKPVITKDDCSAIIVDFANDYFQYWFSDWIFIKNMSDNVIKVLTRDKMVIEIPNNITMAFSFGYAVDMYTIDDLTKEELMEIENVN